MAGAGQLQSWRSGYHGGGGYRSGPRRTEQSDVALPLKNHASCVRLGTAGWAIPLQEADRFTQGGSGLERYSAVFNASEVNSTFRKEHRPATIARWAATVPDGFCFSVKMPKIISHELKLKGTGEYVARFAGLVAQFGSKGGPWLLQLPPSLGFERDVATVFFTVLREHYAGSVVCEPRHASWFEPDAEELFRDFDVSRAAASPSKAPAGAVPGGSTRVVYYRLHGMPRVYYSSYESAFLKALAGSIFETSAAEVWCIFDNTASGAAAANALEMKMLLGPQYRKRLAHTE